VTISPEKKKLYYEEKKNIALYSSAHILCGVYGLGWSQTKVLELGLGLGLGK